MKKWGRKAAKTVLWTALVIACAGVFGVNNKTLAAMSGGEDTGPGILLEQRELKGVWISYLEWNKLPKEEKAFQAAVDEMFDNCRDWGMNAVFVHVRSHSDAMYPSQWFPWSKFASGSAGKSPGYDPLAYMISSAHERGLQFHAWMNPYRITGYLMEWEEVPETAPAKQWLSDQDTANDRWVLNHDGEWYYNPSSPEVRSLVMEGVREVVSGYDVDGIHFDDYFYPELNNQDPARWFDFPEYQNSGSLLSISDWRRENVSQLIQGVYKTVKEERAQTVFGISPQGYVEHLRSDQKLFTDIDRWLSEAGFVDYIMPQLYWGFETKTPSGEEAPYRFEENLKTWIALSEKGSAKLYLGLAAYRAGTDVTDYTEVSEWLRRDDILKRQVEAGRASGRVSGYCFYSYSSFLQSQAQREIDNLLPVLREE